MARKLGSGAYAVGLIAVLIAAQFASNFLPSATHAKEAPKRESAIAKQAAEVSRLEWLSGCWEQRSGTRLVQEQWMEPRGGVMLGMGRTTRGDALVEYEQLRIYERGGKLVYAARPPGQAPAEFVSTEAGDSVIVFANPKHDFPQTIIYCRVGLDSMLARVEGTVRGKKRSIEYRYVHIACPSGGSAPTR